MTRPLRILVIDDEVDVAETVAEQLAVHGYAAEQVTSGAAALKRLAAEDLPGFDVALLDVVMPEMDGIATCQALQTFWPALRVIFISSFVRDDRVFTALRAPVPLVEKPIDWPRLLTLIERGSA